LRNKQSCYKRIRAMSTNLLQTEDESDYSFLLFHFARCLSQMLLGFNLILRQITSIPN
jgi:hypothetical protein